MDGRVKPGHDGESGMGAFAPVGSIPLGSAKGTVFAANFELLAVRHFPVCKRAH
ncbi:hypothetical protein ABIC09_006619 [Bradyrhizobium sp. S3.12.5]